MLRHSRPHRSVPGVNAPHDPHPAPAGATVLRLDGRDALGVLHRISTQRLDDLDEGGARWTLFCDFRGRLLHRAAVARAPGGAVWLLRPDAAGAELAAWVDRHVFREAVRIADAGAGLDVRVVADPAAPAGAEFGPGGEPRRVRPGGGVALELVAAGAPPAGDEGARIRAGRPRHGHEIAADFNPYEVGLAGDVHLSKGCYTGQEALLRLVTYDGVRRALVRLEGAGAPPLPPCEVRAGGAAVGRLTSVAARPGGGWDALAVLRPGAAAEPAALECPGAGAVLAAHPFPAARPLGLP